MIFTDIPTPIASSVYDDAVRAYARHTQRRLVALYQVGNVLFPGVSDIDLLVVVSRARLDNNQFFSVSERLAPRYKCLFLHEPFVLPLTALETITHTSHVKRKLIAGDDVLDSKQPSQSLDERWCKLLESVCNYHVYISQCSHMQVISARLAIAVANTMRYALQDFDDIQKTQYAPSYRATIDALKLRLLEEPAQGGAITKQALELLKNRVDRLKSELCKILPLENGESVFDFSRAFLRGERTIDALDTAQLVLRKRNIDHYYSELYRMKFSYGDLFFLAAYGPSIPRYRQPLVAKALYKACYRAERLLEKVTRVEV